MATGSKTLRRRDSIFYGTLRRPPKALLDPRRCSEPVNLFCRPCLDSGSREEATKYCGQCQIYMCNGCMQGHHAKAKRSHTLPEGRRNYNNVHYDCLKHKSKVVKYFCVSHNIMGCSECISNNHEKCANVRRISEIVEEDGSLELKEKKEHLVETLKVSLKHAQKNKTGLREKERIASETRDKAISKAMVLKKQMQDIVESVVSDIETQANKITSEDVQKIQQQSQEYDYITTNIENLIAELEQTHEGDHNHEQFIAVKTTETNLELIQDKLTDLEENSHISFYDFEPTKEVKRLVDGKTSIGSIQKESMAQYRMDINIKSSRDKSICWVSGVVAMDKNSIVVVDHENCVIKKVDTTSHKILAKHRTSTAPWDITRIGKKHLAFTLPDEKRIQIITVGSKITCSTSVPVDGDCLGIKHANQKLYVTYTSPPKLQILSLNGQVLKTVSTDRRGHLLFSHPFHIAVSPDDRYLYVSDINEHAVTCMTTDGHLVNTYKSYSLTGPLGITADHHGNVYVCGGWSKTVHSLNFDCSNGKEILQNVTDPQALAISEDQKKLLVGKTTSNKLCMFQLD